jgi:hypothetical protein
MALDLEDGAEAVNWHVEVIKTNPPKVKLTALMRSPSDPPVPLTPGSGRTILSLWRRCLASAFGPS